jgi:glucose-1-phosphate cytidylyltransferase
MVAEPELFRYIDDDRTILERAPLERLSAEHKLGVYRHYGYWQCMDT